MADHHERHVLLFLVLFSCFVCYSYAYQFVVGGKDGWVVNPSENYNHWAGRNRFQINDTLFFKYTSGSNSVLVVNKDDYDKCNTGNPTLKLDDGNSIFKFDRSGPFYFISGDKANCDQGQKMIIVVLAIRTPTRPPNVPPPTTAPPKGSLSSPPPKGGAVAPTPANSPLSPYPSGGAPAPSSSPLSPSPSTRAPTPANSPLSPSPTSGAPTPTSSPLSPSPSTGAPAPATQGPGPSPAATSPEPPSSAAPGSPSSSTPGSPSSSTPGSGTPADVNSPPPPPSSLAAPSCTPSFVLVHTTSVVLSVGLLMSMFSTVRLLENL